MLLTRTQRRRYPPTMLAAVHHTHLCEPGLRLQLTAVRQLQSTSTPPSTTQLGMRFVFASLLGLGGCLRPGTALHTSRPLETQCTVRTSERKCSRLVAFRNSDWGWRIAEIQHSESLKWLGHWRTVLIELIHHVCLQQRCVPWVPSARVIFGRLVHKGSVLVCCCG